MARQPDGPAPAPTVQRLWVRYAKRGRLRFSSHRDFQRALERALRRAAVPVAFSAGFSPHPKISYANAAPTGMASEAEYLEIGVTERLDLAAVRSALDSALPPGLDILEVVEAPSREQGGATLADRLQASVWSLRFAGLRPAVAATAVTVFLAAGDVPVERLTKNGPRRFDARAAVLSAEVDPEDGEPDGEPDGTPQTGAPASGVGPGLDPCAILTLVVRHTTPAVRPDDVLTGLRLVADFAPPAPLVTRLAQGPLTQTGGGVADPLAPDQDVVVARDTAGARL